MKHLQEGRPAAAVEILEGLIPLAPESPQLRVLMGMALSSAGRHAEANPHFRKAIEIQPNAFPILKSLAMNEMALGRLREAKPHFEAALQQQRTDPVIHAGLGQIAYSQKSYPDAVAHFERAGDLAAKDPEVVLNFARSCLETSRPEKAGELLTRLPARLSPSLHLQAGLLWARLEGYGNTVGHLEQVGDAGDPYEVGYNLSLAYLRAGKAFAAVRTGEQLLSRGLATAELHSLLSEAFEASGDTQKAYDSLRTATQLEPENPDHYIALIALCLDHRNFDLGIEIAEIGLGRLPGSHRLHLQHGVALAMKGRFDEAQTAFDKAVALGPKSGLTHVGLGLVLMQMDRLPEAVRLLRERRAADPSDYLVNWFLAEALNRSGIQRGSEEEAEAIEALRSSVATYPDLASSRILLGKLLLRRGEAEAAQTQVEKALELEPENVAASYQLAQIYRRGGQAERAKELFAKIQDLKEEDRESFTKRGLAQIIRVDSP